MRILEFEHVPINKQSAIIISRGINWEPRPDYKKWHANVPLPTIAPPKDIKDLTGLKHDKIEIIGYIGNKKSKNGKKTYHKWLAKCFCGRYEIRDGFNFRRHEGSDMCRYCNRVESLKHTH